MDDKENGGQMKLFDDHEWWEKDWNGMPEFKQHDSTPFASIVVHFKNREDRVKFAELVDQTITSLTKSVWYPKTKCGRYKNYAWKSES